MALKNYWLNDSQPNANGDYIAQVDDTETGKVLSVYKGKSIKEVADKILASSASATEQIGRLRLARQPDRAAVQPTVQAPQRLSADDSFRIGQALMDPERAPAAVEEVITKTAGVSPQQLNRSFADLEQDRLKAFWKAETDRFLAETPEYFAHPANMDRILRLLQMKGFDLTSNNLGIVYDELSSQGLLIQAPAGETNDSVVNEQQQSGTTAEANTSAEPNPPRQGTRPRHGLSTGIRTRDTSATRPAPSTAAPKVTRESIARMSRQELAANLRDPAFARQVDALR